MPRMFYGLIACLAMLLIALGSLPTAQSAAYQQVPAPTQDSGVYRSPVPQATPTARPADMPARVGLQVGHWKSNALPDELARLRGSTGAVSDGLREVDLNLAIAKRVEKLLIARGYLVDLLPATVPPSYDADAFVAIHADGASSRNARGFKVATPWRTSTATALLADALDTAYAKATGLPRDGAITFNMRGYYAFSYRRHTHATAPTTPAVILEMGFLTNLADRKVMYDRADAVAQGIANGIHAYLTTRDPRDGTALLPPEFPIYRASAEKTAIRSAPRDNAGILTRIGPNQRLIPFQRRNGWLEVVVMGEWRTVGWVREDQLQATNDTFPTPPPTSG